MKKGVKNVSKPAGKNNVVDEIEKLKQKREQRR